MGTVDYKTKILKELEGLSKEKIMVIIDFIEYIKDKDAWRATRDILSDRDMMRQIKEADEALEKRQKEKFVPWEDIKK